MASKAADLQRVVEFRNRLVAFINYVMEHRTGYFSVPMEDDARRHIASEQPWLAQEYGRLYKIVNTYGVAMAHTPAIGIVSRDVIQDAIHSPDHYSYDHIARLSMQHIDTAIGRLQTDMAERSITSSAPDAIYRVTSVVYWLGRLVVFGRWLLGTNRGRITAIISVIAVAVISGIVSGVAQAWFAQVMVGR